MAHGFLSYNPDMGPSSIEKRLEKKFDEQLDKQTARLEKFIRNKWNEFTFNLATKRRSPNPYRMSREDSVPLTRAFEGSSVKGALSPGSDAVNTTAFGGSLTTLGKRARITGDVDDDPLNRVINLGPPDADGVYGGNNFFAKHAEALPPVGGGDVGSGTTEIVQELREQTQVLTSIVKATDDQTNANQQIANAGQQQAEKLARDAKANAEAASFTNDDFSNNHTAEALASSGKRLMSGRGLGGGMMGGGGLLSMGMGGKVGARKMLTNSIMRRGGSRAGRRMGIALGGRLSQGLGKKLGRKLGGKAIGKVAGKGIAKSLGKKIPLVGLGLGAIFAAQRAMQGDFVGAGLELASGAASTVPGIGTAASVGLDAALMAKDMTAMADGGITDGPVNALIGEEGREGVFPLEGSKGKKTFLNFGKGIMEAQKSNKGLFGKLQAEGFKEYYDKQNGLSRFMDGFAGSGFFEGLKEILGAITLPMGYKPFNFNDNGDSSSGSSEDSGQYGKKKDGFWSKRHSGEQMEVNADGVFTSKIGGVVTKIGEHDDLGKYVDIVNAEKGVTERIADIDGVVPGIEVGSTIGPGDPVANGNDSGMIHYEIRNGGNDNPEKYKAKFGHGGTKDPNEFLEGITNDVSNNIEGSTTDVDNSTVLNNLSEETGAKANSGTTIINNVVNEQSNASNNQGNDVQAASNSGDMVSAAHAIMAFRA